MATCYRCGGEINGIYTGGSYGSTSWHKDAGDCVVFLRRRMPEPTGCGPDLFVFALILLLVVLASGAVIYSNARVRAIETRMGLEPPPFKKVFIEPSAISEYAEPEPKQ